MRVAETEDDLDYFELPEKRVALNLKVPASVKEQLRAIVRLWKIMAEARQADPDDIDLTYVSVRLLHIGVDGVWGQMAQMAGLDGMPQTEDEWTKLTRAIVKNVEAERASLAKKK